MLPFVTSPATAKTAVAGVHNQPKKPGQGGAAIPLPVTSTTSVATSILAAHGPSAATSTPLHSSSKPLLATHSTLQGTAPHASLLIPTPVTKPATPPLYTPASMPQPAIVPHTSFSHSGLLSTHGSLHSPAASAPPLIPAPVTKPYTPPMAHFPAPNQAITDPHFDPSAAPLISPKLRGHHAMPSSMMPTGYTTPVQGSFPQPIDQALAQAALHSTAALPAHLGKAVLPIVSHSTLGSLAHNKPVSHLSRGGSGLHFPPQHLGPVALPSALPATVSHPFSTQAIPSTNTQAKPHIPIYASHHHVHTHRTWSTSWNLFTVAFWSAIAIAVLGALDSLFRR